MGTSTSKKGELTDTEPMKVDNISPCRTSARKNDLCPRSPKKKGTIRRGEKGTKDQKKIYLESTARTSNGPSNREELMKKRRQQLQLGPPRN